MAQLDFVPQLGKLFHPNFSPCDFTLLLKPETPTHQLLQVFPHPGWRDDSTQEIPRLAVSCSLPGKGGWAGIHLADLFWELCSSELCLPLAGRWKPVAVFILEGCCEWHHPWVQHLMGTWWFISVGVSHCGFPVTHSS